MCGPPPCPGRIFLVLGSMMSMVLLCLVECIDFRLFAFRAWQPIAEQGHLAEEHPWSRKENTLLQGG